MLRYFVCLAPKNKIISKKQIHCNAIWDYGLLGTLCSKYQDQPLVRPLLRKPEAAGVKAMGGGKSQDLLKFFPLLLPATSVLILLPPELQPTCPDARYRSWKL